MSQYIAFKIMPKCKVIEKKFWIANKINEISNNKKDPARAGSLKYYN